MQQWVLMNIMERKPSVTVLIIDSQHQSGRINTNLKLFGGDGECGGSQWGG